MEDVIVEEAWEPIFEVVKSVSVVHFSTHFLVTKVSLYNANILKEASYLTFKVRVQMFLCTEGQNIGGLLLREEARHCPCLPYPH